MKDGIANFVSAAMKIAKERKSSVLASNAVHHRIDSLTSIVALVAIVGSHVLDNVSWLDPVGGLLVSMMVIRAGWGNTGSALLELADVGIAEEVKDAVRRTASETLSEGPFGPGRVMGNLVEVRDVQGVKAGQNYLMDVELAVPGEWTVQEIRLVEDKVRKRLGFKIRGVRRVRVRFVAMSDQVPDFTDEFISSDVYPRGSPEPDHQDHTNSHPHNHTNNQEYTKSSLNSKAEKRN